MQFIPRRRVVFLGIVSKVGVRSFTEMYVPHESIFCFCAPRDPQCPDSYSRGSNPSLSCIIIHRVKIPWKGLCLAGSIGGELLTEMGQRIGTGPEKETPGENEVSKRVKIPVL
jgi:hypothetical protein